MPLNQIPVMTIFQKLEYIDCDSLTSPHHSSWYNYSWKLKSWLLPEFSECSLDWSWWVWVAGPKREQKDFARLVLILEAGGQQGQSDSITVNETATHLASSHKLLQQSQAPLPEPASTWPAMTQLARSNKTELGVHNTHLLCPTWCFTSNVIGPAAPATITTFGGWQPSSAQRISEHTSTSPFYHIISTPQPRPQLALKASCLHLVCPWLGIPRSWVQIQPYPYADIARHIALLKTQERQASCLALPWCTIGAIILRCRQFGIKPSPFYVCCLESMS